MTTATKTQPATNGALDLEVANHNRTLIRADTVRSVPDAQFEARIGHYPTEVKDPLRWLHGYCRSQCHNSHDILAQQAAELGYNYAVNYWYQVLTGRYFQRRQGDGKVQGSVQNLLETIAALRRHDELARAAGKVPFVDTSTWEKIRDYIDLKRAPENVCKFGAIVGETGSGKSACLKRYRAENNHGACVHFEAPSRPSLLECQIKLARCYGIENAYRSSLRRQQILENVNERKCIMIDNVQRLYDPRHGHNQPVFSWLQELQDDTNCTIILSWTPTFTDKLTAGVDRGYFEQFVGRIGGVGEILTLPTYPPAEDVRLIAKTFGVADIKEAMPLLREFVRRQGRIRILFSRLQAARRLADAEQSAQITLDHLQAADQQATA